jgi:AcrR family transcriptional regulator
VTETVGRRERKKAATRQALADAALRLFLERGYDQVSIKEIADAADVSTTTLFKHFPGKEALLFDEDEEQEAVIVAAVRDRPAGQSIPQALHELTRRRRELTATDPDFARMAELMAQTPALRHHASRMWMRHEQALAAAIAADTGAAADDPAARALAHFALDAVNFARDAAYPEGTLTAAFDLLEKGWPA